MSAGPASAEDETTREPTAAERQALEQRREQERVRLEADLNGRYGAGAPALGAPGAPTLHETEVDLRHAVDQGLMGPRDPDQPLNLDNVEAGPRYQPVLEGMRTRWNATVDAEAPAREAVEWPGGVPAVGTRANPSIEDASGVELDLVADKSRRLVGTEPDGLYNVVGRVEGTSPASRLEVERNRRLLREGERDRRREEILARVVPGPRRVPDLVTMAEEGIARGEYRIREYSEERPPAKAGGRPTYEKRYGIEPAGHAENRELAPEYVGAFNDLLATIPEAERNAFSDSLGRIPKDRVAELVEQGNQAIERGAEQARRAVEARETIRRLGSTPEERAATAYEVRRDEVGERRTRWYRERPQVKRPGEYGRLNFDDAYDQAMNNNSVWAAGVRAVNNMPREFWDRYDAVRVQRDATGDRGLRDTLDESMNQMMAEAQERQAKAEAEQQRRNEMIMKDPARMREVASGAFQQDRRNYLMRMATPPNDIYATYDPDQDRFGGGPMWGPGGIESDYEQEAVKPFLKQAMAARAQGRVEDEARYLGQAADALETAFGEIQEAAVDSQHSSIEIAGQLAEAVRAKESGTFTKGRTTNEQLNQLMIRDLMTQLGITDTEGHLNSPDGALVHRDERPTRKNGKPMLGRRGKILAKDLIYRVPGFDNAVMVTRWNPDGQLISCEVQVTESTAMRQRHGSGPLDSGGFTREATPELEARLNAQFEEQKGAAANPERADRQAGSVISIGRNAGNMGTDSGGGGYGYRIPEQGGGLWARETIQDRLMRSGMDAQTADQVSHRRMPQRQNAMPRRWWWEKAANRDYQATSIFQRRSA